MKKLYAELLLATSFWGMGFVTAAWALESVGPVWMAGLRFLGAAIAIQIFIRHRISWPSMKAVFWPGFFLAALMITQTWGLKYTTPTKCGFITVFYVMWIPLLERMLYGTPFRKSLFVWIGLAIFGAALICGAITSEGFSSDFSQAFNLGDLLTLICSICAAAQCLTIPHAVKKVSSPTEFHVHQSLWVFLLCAIFAIPLEGFSFLQTPWTTRAALSMFQLIVFSSAIGFLIQVRVQKVLSPATAGVLILLESPWALFFAVTMIGEQISILQGAGCVLMLIAAMGETYFSAHSTSSRTSTG